MHFFEFLVFKMDTVTLKSMDGQTLVVSMESAKISKTIETMLAVMEEDDTEPIPVMKVDAKVLGVVFEWISQKLKV